MHVLRNGNCNVLPCLPFPPLMLADEASGNQSTTLGRGDLSGGAIDRQLPDALGNWANTQIVAEGSAQLAASDTPQTSGLQSICSLFSPLRPVGFHKRGPAGSGGGERLGKLHGVVVPLRRWRTDSAYAIHIPMRAVR